MFSLTLILLTQTAMGHFMFQDKDASDSAGKDVSVEMRLDGDRVNGDENGNCLHQLPPDLAVNVCPSLLLSCWK